MSRRIIYVEARATATALPFRVHHLPPSTLFSFLRGHGIPEFSTIILLISDTHAPLPSTFRADPFNFLVTSRLECCIIPFPLDLRSGFSFLWIFFLINVLLWLTLGLRALCCNLWLFQLSTLID
ncbi:hypothetical protein PM082_017171 [Marasmius tenuissimus]|nr:hypothetical protein PM082_017171 [Marasmius tenuissimus]